MCLRTQPRACTCHGGPACSPVPSRTVWDAPFLASRAEEGGSNRGADRDPVCPCPPWLRPQETSLTAQGGNRPCVWPGDFPEPKLSSQRAGRTFGHGQFNQKQLCLTTSHSRRSGART